MAEPLDVEAGAAECARLIAKARGCVVLSGAGISTESGLRDFRSPGTGLWETVDPMEGFSYTAFRTRPRFFYEFIADFAEPLINVQPNDAHLACAELEQMGYVSCVVTQNIDGLHHKAGSRLVHEVHGHLRTASCVGCSRAYPMSEVLRRVRSGEIPPRCDVCAGAIKPDVVLFEESLPADFYYAQQAVLGAELLLVVGSSLEIAPVCYLPGMARQLAIVNLQPTPYDGAASVVVRGRAGETMKKVVERLKELKGTRGQ